MFIESGIATWFESGDVSMLAGKSGVELAEYSGVPMRTIQQYEQCQKNINKAQVKYLVRWSKELYCGITDLMEKTE